MTFRRKEYVALLDLDSAPNKEATIRSPAVGVWHYALNNNALVGPGISIGTLEILGARYRLVMPDCVGLVRISTSVMQPLDVGYNDPLFLVDVNQTLSAADSDTENVNEPASTGLVFCAAQAGRYYDRPAPDQPPFVQPGDTIKTGDPVCLLEIMKTFTRVIYGGPDLPPSVCVAEIIPVNGADIAAGDAILRFELP